MEFCELLPGQQYKKPTADGDLTTAILKYTPKGPRERLDLILEALKNTGVLNYQGGNTYLTQAGISIDSTPLKIHGTLLPSLQMTFRERTDVVCLLKYINKESTKGLTRHLRMDLGTPSLPNTLPLHYKSTSTAPSNLGVFSILHHLGRIPSTALSRVLLENPLNLVSIYLFDFLIS